ncbi:MAG: hypothetical protein KME40_19655 [Komarekiella atlantica HA4396-MV6]|jgi:hypothetical protein|nr:hypothetical protein [Komarekiella atlantica HA4396-MV6]
MKSNKIINPRSSDACVEKFSSLYSPSPKKDRRRTSILRQALAEISPGIATLIFRSWRVAPTVVLLLYGTLREWRTRRVAAALTSLKIKN